MSNQDNNNNNNNTPRNNTRTNNEHEDRNRNTTTPSLSSRIQSSATELTRNAFFTPSTSTPTDLSQALASGSNKGGAGAGVGVGVGAASASGPSADLHGGFASGSGSGAASGSAAASAESFRSTDTPHGQEGIGFGFDEFQGAYDNGSGIQPYLGTDRAAGIKGKGKGRQYQPQQPQQPHLQPEQQEQEQNNQTDFNTIWQHHHHQPQPQIYHPDNTTTDGSAVISLLTNPTFDPEFPFDPETQEHPDTNLPPPQQPLTKPELDMIDSFRRQQLPQSSTRNTNLSSTSLIPDIGDFLTSIPASTQNDATALRDAVLTSLPGAEDWVAVEERYHDEVWGFLRPTLEAAKQEIESGGGEASRQGPDGSAVDGPAVARLKMVLRHMAV